MEEFWIKNKILRSSSGSPIMAVIDDSIILCDGYYHEFKSPEEVEELKEKAWKYDQLDK